MATKEEIKRSKELVDEAIEVLLKKTGTKKFIFKNCFKTLGPR